MSTEEYIPVFYCFPGPDFRDRILSSHEHPTATEYACEAHNTPLDAPMFEHSVYHIGRATRGIDAALAEKGRKQAFV
jgi:hypothetical protein